MTITEARFVKIDQNDIRQIGDICDGAEIEALNDQLGDGELELCPGLMGWGQYNYTATHRETGMAYHVAAS